MFDIGFGELLLVALLALVVLGPERLPQFMRALAQIVKQLRAAAHNLSKAFEVNPDPTPPPPPPSPPPPSPPSKTDD